ncbi:MAG: outer membrane lipoprotein chaperone LolA [Gammaproteobacteria bacterium]
MRLATLSALLLSVLGAVTATAEELTALDRYLEGLVSWRAQFTQSMSDSRGRLRETQRGQLIVQRPGKFRWVIGPPEQVMVADGRNVWFYDRDLEQVTVRAAGTALSATPAMLLAGTAPLRATFKVLAAGKREGLEWVKVQPLGAGGDFREARFGFAGLELRRLEIDDKLGQKALLLFENGIRNPRLDLALLRFEPPAGADVIGKPVE